MISTTIYDENVEWVFSSTSGKYNSADNSDPHTGLLDLAYTSNTGGAAAAGSWTSPVSVTSDLMVQLSLWIQPTNWPNGRTVVLAWQDVNGSQLGSSVTIQNGTFGFNTGNNAYQNLVIPISSFAIPSGSQVRALGITSSSGIFNYFLDTVVLSSMAISCNPSDVANAARCFSSCVPDHMAVRSLLISQFVPCIPTGGGTTPIIGCNQPAAPANLAASNVTSSGFTVTWTQPAGANVTQYQVIWSLFSQLFTPAKRSGSAIVSGGTLTYNITGLQSSTTYYVEIIAFNGLCQSNASSVLSQATNAPGPPPNGLLNGLLHYWNMDSYNANTIQDIVGTENMIGTNGGADMSLTNNGILTNCITCTGAGAVNQMVSFAPTNTDLIIQTVPSVGSITYQCWFWLAAAQPAGFPICMAAFGAAGAAQYMAMFVSAATNIPTFRYYNNGGVNVDVNWTGAVTRQAWHHFIAGYDASVGESFIQIDNGARVFSAAFTPRANNNTFDWCFFNGTSINNEAAARLDELAVWNRALSTTDVSNLWNGGNALSEGSFTN